MSSLRYVALALSLVWASWWVFFETLEALGSGQFGQAIFFAVVMLGAFAIACRWGRIGGVVLLAESVAALVLFAPGWMRGFSALNFLIMFVMMPAPPLVAGTLLLIGNRRRAPDPRFPDGVNHVS